MVDFDEILTLLKNLIAIPSYSREEKEKADFLEKFLSEKDCEVQRVGNNLWCSAWELDSAKPTIMLNSHIDTVRPSEKWTFSPHTPTEVGERIYGLGANDAHGSVVALTAAFLRLRETRQNYNLLLALSAEEEISGKNGMEFLLKNLPNVNFSIVGEPTKLEAAVAEKGLMVIDGVAEGKSGHAAREEGVNAIYKAMEDINFLKKINFEKTNPLLGKVKLSVTQISAGFQHNVVPDECKFVVDVRSNGCYTNEEIFLELQKKLTSKISARSFRLNPSYLSETHPMYRRLQEMKVPMFGSTTISDQALISCASVKIGVGDSARSHTADEFVEKSEIERGIEFYFELLNDWNFE